MFDVTDVATSACVMYFSSHSENPNPKPSMSSPFMSTSAGDFFGAADLLKEAYNKWFQERRARTLRSVTLNPHTLSLNAGKHNYAPPP